MERDEERVEHESGIYNLSSETRELRNAGRKLVSDEDGAMNEDRQLIGAVKQLQESVTAQRADISRAVKKMNQMLYEMPYRNPSARWIHNPRTGYARSRAAP